MEQAGCLLQAVERNMRRAPSILPYLMPEPADDTRRAVRMQRSTTAA